MGTKIALVLDTKIYTTETFWNLYYDTLYSLYPDLFIGNDVMLLTSELLMDKELYGKNLLTLSSLYSMDQVSAYFNKECKICEIL